MSRPTLRRYYRHGLFPQLMVFEAVARLGSVTHAAEELHLAQPTVSTQLKKLSGNLGVTLLEQRGRGLCLTPAGRDLLAGCRELTDLFARLEKRLAALRIQRSDVLRIAATPGGRHLGARFLAAFCMRHPGVQASLHVASRTELLGRLATGEDDFCLIPAPDDRPGLVMKPAATEWLRVYAPAGHSLLVAHAIRPKALATEAFVLREPGSSMRETMLAVCAAQGLRPVVRAELASNEAVAEAIAGGLGLGLLPDGAAQAFACAGAIVALDVQGFPLRREWKLARAKGRQLSLTAELFSREILEDAENGQQPVAPPALHAPFQGLML